MGAAAPVRIAALGRDVRQFHERVNSFPASDAATPADVAPLYDEADRLARRVAGLVASPSVQEYLAQASGWDRRHAREALASARNGARTVAQQTGVGRERNAEATHRRSDMASAAAADMWEQARDGRDLPNVRLVGPLAPPAVNLVAGKLDNVPGAVIDAFDAAGARGTLFSGKLTDVHGFRGLSGKRPRGWSPGSVWDRVPGVARGAKGFAANPQREQTGRGHAAVSLALHEFAHVVDTTSARPTELTISNSPRWQRGPFRELQRVGGDLPQRRYEASHPSEWFAESLASYLSSPQHRAALARWYPETHAFLEREFGEPDFTT